MPTSYSRDPNAQGYQGAQAQTPTAQSAAQSTWNANAYKNQAGGQPGYQSQLGSWYEQYLGRPAGQSDYLAHAGSPNYSALLGTIQRSPEAQAYARSQAQQAQGATYANPTGTPVQGDGTIPMAQPLVSQPQAQPAQPSQQAQLGQSAQLAQRQPDQGLPNYQYLSNLYQQLIENPAFSPAVINQMKERQKDQAVSLLQQQQSQLGDRFAGLNRWGSGAQLAGEAQAREAANQNILGAFRDIDIETAGKNALQQLQAGQQYGQLGLGQVGAQDSAINNILNWARFFDSGALARAGLGLQGAQLQGNLQNQLMSMILGYGG